MLTDAQLPTHPSFALAGRILFASLFILSGLTHFTNIPYYVDLMPEEIPFQLFWILVSGVIELIGAVLILLNWRARLGAWLIVVFMIPVTFAVHGYEMLYADTAIERAMQQAHFLKGLALTGAALVFTQIGVSRPNSADTRS